MQCKFSAKSISWGDFLYIIKAEILYAHDKEQQETRYKRNSKENYKLQSTNAFGLEFARVKIMYDFLT